MLTAKLINGEIVTSGSVKFMDNYPGFCCAVFNWEVYLLYPDDNPDYISIWGQCDNPKCTEFQEPLPDPFFGVSNSLQCDFAAWLVDGRSLMPFPQTLIEAYTNAVYDPILDGTGGKKHGN